MGSAYKLVRGVSVRPVGQIWVAFSPASGETLLLNDESAAVLEVLIAHASAGAPEIISTLAADSGVDFPSIAARLADCWAHLVQSGLIRQFDAASDQR